MRLRKKIADRRGYSVEDLIRSGVLMSHDLFMPQKIARFAATLNRDDPLCIRRGTVGNITTIPPNGTQGGIVQAWNAQRSTNVPTPISAIGPIQNNNTTARAPVVYTFGSTGATAINQIAQVHFAVTEGTPVSFAMDAWAGYFNVIGDSAPTFSAIKEWWAEVLVTAQGGATTPTLPTTFGDAASNAWAGILNATGIYTLGPGGLWHHQDQTSAGVEITASDVLKIANTDTVFIATIRLTAFGYK